MGCMQSKPKPANPQELLDDLITRHKITATRNITSDQEVRISLAMADEMLDSGLPMQDIAREIYSDAYIAPAEGQAVQYKPANIINACKEAESRLALKEPGLQPCHLTLVFPMFHEQNRILPSTQHANGQNFVRNKVRQLDWLFNGVQGMTYDIIAVDDGCDKNSAGLMRDIVMQERFDDRVRVAHIQEAIDQKIPAFSALKTPADSRKGGAVLYGMHLASAAPHRFATPNKRHLVMFTDSDMSASVAMAGLLISKMLKGAKIASGARYGTPTSYLVTEKGATGHPESGFQQPNVVHISIRQFIRATLLPDLAKMYDSNVGFKCWDAADIPELLPKMSIFGPAFDMQLLLAGTTLYSNRAKEAGQPAGEIIGVAPILFVEDFAESNFTSNDSDPDASAKGFLRMSDEMCMMHFDYMIATKGATTPEQKKWAAFIKLWTLGAYKKIIEGVEKDKGRRLTLEEEYKIEDFMRYTGLGLVEDTAKAAKGAAKAVVGGASSLLSGVAAKLA